MLWQIGMWDSELVTRKLFLKLLVGKMEGGIIAIICCYQDRWDLFREQRQALPLNPVTLTHPGALHWKEKNQRLALWIAHISEWGRMSPALAGLTLLHITCAWSPVSTLQPCGAAPTWANTAPALEISQQDYRGDRHRCEAGQTVGQTRWHGMHSPSQVHPRLCYMGFMAEVKHKSVVDGRQAGTLWGDFFAMI